jgi:hypothetical protein
MRLAAGASVHPRFINQNGVMTLMETLRSSLHDQHPHSALACCQLIIIQAVRMFLNN